MLAPYNPFISPGNSINALSAFYCNVNIEYGLTSCAQIYLGAWVNWACGTNAGFPTESASQDTTVGCGSNNEYMWRTYASLIIIWPPGSNPDLDLVSGPGNAYWYPCAP